MADSSEPAFLFLYRKGAVAPVDYLSTFATAPCQRMCFQKKGEIVWRCTSPVKTTWKLY